MSTLAIRQKLVDIARKEVGVLEAPRNSNRGKRVQEYQRATTLAGTGWAYCAAFVCWCIREWGRDPEVLKALKMTPAQFERWRPKTASAYGLDDWARSKGLKVYSENARPNQLEIHTGDLVTFDFSHTGIIDTDTVSKVYSKARIHTIEGNTDEAGGRDGGGVYEKDRARSIARTFIRLID